jgi:hypothetical protein
VAFGHTALTIVGIESRSGSGIGEAYPVEQFSNSFENRGESWPGEGSAGIK